mgnify:CR=1 FL=1
MTSASEIRTIFWDIGGVLLTNGWDQGQQTRVLTALGVDLPAYEAVHDDVNYYWERGLISAQDFFEQTVLETNPQLHLTFDRLWQLVCAESKVLHQECFDILAALKRSGRYRLATLNNESRELNVHRLDAFHLRQFFDYFICSGYVHEMKPLPDIYRASSVCVLAAVNGKPATRGAHRPSASDLIHFGIPNVILEAMACGVPVVTTRLEALGEVLQGDAADAAQQNGVYVPERDPPALAAALAALAADPARRAAIGARAVARIRAGFDIHVTSGEVAEALGMPAPAAVPRAARAAV